MRMDFNWILGRDNSGAYRQFNTPKAINDDVAKYHQLLMGTVVAIITTLVITSIATNVVSVSYGKNPDISIYSQGKHVENKTTEQLCRYEMAREILPGITLKTNEKLIWAETIPVAACCFCLLVWLLTYPLLYVNKQWVQRFIYYLMVTSKVLAVSSLLVRPLLLYLVWQFMMSFGFIFLGGAAATLFLMYWDHCNRH